MGGELQEKIAAVKQATAENLQKLHQYQWMETTQLTLNGEAKPPKTSMCRYGPDGTVQKTPIGPPPQPPSGGRMKQRIIEKKTEEMQEYMGQVKSLLSMYVPPDPQKMGQTFQAGNASLNPPSGGHCLQELRSARRSDDALVQCGHKKDQRGEREHLYGQSERHSHIGSSDG